MQSHEKTAFGPSPLVECSNLSRVESAWMHEIKYVVAVLAQILERGR